MPVETASSQSQNFTTSYCPVPQTDLFGPRKISRTHGRRLERRTGTRVTGFPVCAMDGHFLLWTCCTHKTRSQFKCKCGSHFMRHVLCLATYTLVTGFKIFTCSGLVNPLGYICLLFNINIGFAV